MRVVYLQALYYIYILTQDSAFRYSFDCHTAKFYFTVALLLSLDVVEPGVITERQLARLAEFPRSMIRESKSPVRDLLRWFRTPSDRVLGRFISKIIHDICREGANRRWNGHRRIRLMRQVLLSHCQEEDESPTQSETSFSDL
ncbi:unnamed protein product [Agarophyton chilense]